MDPGSNRDPFILKLKAMAKKEFELIFHVTLTKVLPEDFGYDTETKVKMKGEFQLMEVEAIRAAVIIQFIDELNKKIKMAIDGGYNLS